MRSKLTRSVRFFPDGWSVCRDFLPADPKVPAFFPKFVVFLTSLDSRWTGGTFSIPTPDILIWKLTDILKFRNLIIFLLIVEKKKTVVEF